MSEELTAQERVEVRERYSQWTTRSVGVGVAGCFLGTAAWMVTGEPLVLFAGLGLYWLGCLGMAAAYVASPISLRDELDARIQREASQLTVTVLTAVTLVALPADVVLSSTGVYTAPAAVRGAIWGYFGLLAVSLVVHGLVKRRYA